MRGIDRFKFAAATTLIMATTSGCKDQEDIINEHIGKIQAEAMAKTTTPAANYVNGIKEPVKLVEIKNSINRDLMDIASLRKKECKISGQVGDGQYPSIRQCNNYERSDTEGMDILPESNSSIPGIYEAFQALKVWDVDKDNTLSIDEQSAGFQPNKITIPDDLSLVNSGNGIAINIPINPVPLTAFHVMEVHQKGNISNAYSAKSVFNIFDSNYDGSITNADDADGNGQIDSADGKMYRTIIDNLRKKYGEIFDVNKITSSDILFALVDIGAMEKPIGTLSAQTVGFEKSIQQSPQELVEESTIKDRSYREYTGENISGAMLGGGLGLAGSSLLKLSTPFALAATLIGAGIGGQKSSTEHQDITEVFKQVTQYTVQTEDNKPVRVIMFELQNGWKLFSLDASTSTSDTITVEIMRKLKNNQLETETKVETKTTSPGSYMQSTSGRWLIQAPESEGSRIVLFTDTNNSNNFKFNGIYEDQDVGHPERIGKLEILAEKHKFELTQLLEGSLPQLSSIAKGISSFDPTKGMKREASALKVLASLEVKN